MPVGADLAQVARLFCPASRHPLAFSIDAIMPVRIERSLAAVAPGESFLEFSVYRSPQDGRASGYLNFGHQSPAHRALAYAPYALSLADAWRLACDFVRDSRIDVIWVNDLECLFEDPRLPNAGCAAGAPAGPPVPSRS